MPKFVRVFTGPDGQSCLEHYEPPFEDFLDTEGAYGRGTPMQATSGMTIRISPPDYFLDFHCAPRRQYTVTLAGQAEIGLSDGSTHRVGPGDVLLAEDLTGQGHTTRVVGGDERVYLVIPLAD